MQVKVVGKLVLPQVQAYDIYRFGSQQELTELVAHNEAI